MLKKAAGSERHGALTILAPVRRHEATHSSPRAPRIVRTLKVPQMRRELS